MTVSISLSLNGSWKEFTFKAGRMNAVVSSDVSGYEWADLRHVKEKFPNVNDLLAARLGQAITRRRKYLIYRKKHADKLRKGINHDVHTGSAILSETVATDVRTWNIDADNRASESGFSQTSYAPTLVSGGAITIPSPPEASHNGTPFKCPYCYYVITKYKVVEPACLPRSSAIPLHRTELALFILPRNDDGDSDEDDSEAKLGAHSSRGSSTSVPMGDKAVDLPVYNAPTEAADDAKVVDEFSPPRARSPSYDDDDSWDVRAHSPRRYRKGSVLSQARDRSRDRSRRRSREDSSRDRSRYRSRSHSGRRHSQLHHREHASRSPSHLSWDYETERKMTELEELELKDKEAAHEPAKQEMLIANAKNSPKKEEKYEFRKRVLAEFEREKHEKEMKEKNRKEEEDKVFKARLKDMYLAEGYSEEGIEIMINTKDGEEKKKRLEEEDKVLVKDTRLDNQRRQRRHLSW
ncbi:MAG: hypothetical protein Q9185_004759 [Variospora sp. 1 TL-2023]